MRSCIASFYLTLLALTGAAPIHALAPPSAQNESEADPNALYARRDDVSSARRAAAVWADRLTRNGRDFESAWKLSRARYWLGGHAPAAERRRELELGMDAAKQAIAATPDRPEGHFWLAANMALLAETSGLLTGLKYRGAIKRELEAARQIDPAYLLGSPDRALGRWYYQVPSLFGGDKKKSEEHLRRSLTYFADSVLTHFWLAETLLSMGRKQDARNELQLAVDAPVHPDWAPEDREFKQKASEALAKLK